DEATLATVDQSGAVRLWDVSTGMPLSPALPHRGFVQGMAFSPDGRRLFTGSEAGVACWELAAPAEGSTSELVDWARLVTGLELTRDGEVRQLTSDTWQRLRAARREQEVVR